MSKAFTRETDDDPAGDAPVRARESDLPPGTANYVTPRGLRALRDELDALAREARPAAQAAAAAGADPAAAKRELAQLDARARYLAERLATAEVVDAPAEGRDRVAFGATAVVRDDAGREQAYRIVGVDEADARRGWVSFLSPVARALLGARAGDVVVRRTPRGDDELEVLAVRYDEPA